MSKVQVSISTCFNYGIPIEGQIPLIAEAGFTHVSLGQNLNHFDYLSAERRQRLSKLLDRFSLNIDTIHGPQADKTNTKDITAAAESAVDIHAPVVVMHAGPFDFGDNELAARLAQLKELCPLLVEFEKMANTIEDARECEAQLKSFVHNYGFGERLVHEEPLTLLYAATFGRKPDE